MPELALTTLKFVFLALLYLFVARAIRIIWLDLGGSRASGKPRAAPAPRPQPIRASSKQASIRPRSLLVSDDGSQPKTVPLSGDPVTFGRAEECTVALHDGYASQMHTKIFDKDGVWHVMDLGSTNGTFLNRVKLDDPMPLAPGDEIRLGKTVIEVRAK